MAKQQTGVNSTTIGMIAFVALWLTSTVILVILYTNQSDLQNHNARLEAENRLLISSSEKNSIALAKEAQEGGPTVVGLLEEARRQTADLASGDGADSVAAVRDKRDQLFRMIKSDNLVAAAESLGDASYHEALSQVYAACKAGITTQKSNAERIAQLEAEVNRLVEADTARQTQFEQKTKEVAEKLALCESGRTDQRAETDKIIQRLEGELDELRRRSTEEVRRERELRTGAEERLAEVQERFAIQQQKFGEMYIGPAELSTVRQPDGRILTAIPGDPAVYISRGAKDSIILGLQFAVYSSQTGIPADGRAKAQIEVVSISPTSAECRVVWVAPHQVILPDDLIANPVYDPARPPTFVVAGEFDLDRDGILDRNGAAAVIALISNWGGQVAEELTPLTDFVVLGAAPRRLRRSGETSTAGQGEIGAAASAYFELAESARVMSIPIMTQEVFLNFLGYASRRL